MSSDNYATTGALNYFLAPPDGSRPYNNINANSVTGEHARNWMEDHRIVNIKNVRGSEDQYTFDNAGFQFGRQVSRHTRFVDDKEIEQEYSPECVELIKNIATASSVVIFDHTIRRHRPGEADDSPQNRQPVALVHRRFQIPDLWRPISHTALDWPLALCDFRSVDVKRDLTAVTLIYPDREGGAYSVKYNDSHKWKYMRGMEPDEYVFIKCFDSVQDGSVAILTPHTGFQDPNSPEGAPLRQSIEIRALVFYDD
ncbi:hypothetical protein PAXRUDRAFT_35226 [Paxillus rubicundulus Ve08.2h10]|uniref:Methyltransferase n=1 Tax=Paxillus rubicundulus Ve08.2h10 TaxID=930991 RepID=A0A0D0DWU5_9AGAM|nr:hypothetical protein PAXRUDRAFT_35226 [Paxillus rubicundulus Ve08.2h10]